MKHDRRLVIAASLTALVLSSLPYAVAYLTAPADRVFMGIVSSVPDWSQYLAWMRAFAHGTVIENVLTCEPQSPAFFNLQWLVLGRLSNWIPAAVVLQGFRLLTAVFFLWLTWRISREYYRDEPDSAPAWTAWILINFSSGLGWFWVVEKRVSGALRYPMDVYIYEPVSFQNMMVFPHFLLAAALLLLIFRLAVMAIEEERRGPAWIAALLALALGLTHAYDLIIVYGVLAVYVLCLFDRNGLSWRPVLVAGLIAAVSAPPPAYFVYLTTSDPLWRQVLAQFGNAGVFTPSPLRLLMLVGLPLLLTLVTWRNVFPRRWPAPWPLMVRVWAVVNFPLLYIPADYQVHMLSGWQIPLGLLASEGLFHSILPRLKAAGWWRDGGASPRRFALSRRGAVVLVLLLVVPTNVYLLAWRVLEVLKRQHTHYLYQDEMAALTWLDRQADDGDVVLGSLVVSEYVPFVAGNKVVLGHWAQTVRYEDKKAAVSRFFDAATPETERQRLLASCRVRYVLHGRAERELGGFDPGRAPYLTLAHESGETSVYRVDLDLTAAAAAKESPTAAATTETSPNWSSPVWLSRAYAGSWFPEVTVDQTGTAHVFWSSPGFQRDRVIHCVIGSDGCASTTVAGTRVGRDGHYVVRSTAAVDSRGMLHLLWKAKYDVVYQRLFLPDPVEGWTRSRRLGEGIYMRLTIDADDRVHVAWTQPQMAAQADQDPCRGCADVVYSRSEDGGDVWTPPKRLFDTPTGSEKPGVALGRDGEIHLVWEEGLDFYQGRGEPAPALVTTSLDSGRTWKSPVAFSPSDLPMSPAIAVAGDGTAVVAWRSTTRPGVFSQASSDRGATWSEPQQLPGLLPRFNAPDELDGMDMAADAAGKLHLVATGRPAEESHLGALYHLVWDNGSWSEPEALFVTGGVPEWPRIAVGNGNRLHVAWFEREAGTVWKSEAGAFRVWYSSSLADAPATTPVAWPKPQATVVRPETVSRLGQLLAAILVVGAVIYWTRRRGL